jgi:ribosomal-protein-alanine N-acetyltransferase
MSACSPHLRFAAAPDLPALHDIERRAFPDPWSRVMLEAELSSPYSFLLVAAPTEGRAPVAYAAFRTAAEEAELLRLAVIPEERHRGLGRALVDRGLERLVWEGIGSCFLEVREDNAHARRLYEHAGFTCTGRRRAYYRDGSDALVYVRAVPGSE